jgi:hypothetical protein
MQQSPTGYPQRPISGESRGRIIFVVGATVFASLVGFGVSRLDSGAGPGTSLNVLSPAGNNITATTASASPSVGYDGPPTCAPTTHAATSGGSPAALEQSASEVANGTIEGATWSLWSAKDQSGAEALEDAGLVFNGREYGLCPGFPNPSETEMIETGGDAIIYGVVNYPGLATVEVGTGSQGFTMGTNLPSPHVAVVNGVSFYIGTLPRSACDYTYLVVETTSRSASAENNVGFGEDGVGQEYSNTNNAGNTGTCVAGRLDPLSFSQGEWGMPAGQFQS